MAVRGNEIKRHRNFSEKHFSGVTACGFCLIGHGGGAVWGGSSPSVCYLVRGFQAVFITECLVGYIPINRQWSNLMSCIFAQALPYPVGLWYC